MFNMESHDHSSLAPCGAFLDDQGGCHWRLWAPRARAVRLVLIDDQGARRSDPMRSLERGYFAADASGIVVGQRYAFRLDDGPERPDPASRWQPDGVHAPSAVWNPGSFRWTDSSWRGVRREDLVIYELNVGTFTPTGTLEGVIPRLPALRDLGITAIELMPLAQFPGTRGWGYDGVHWCAVQNSYGGPRALQQLVDASHHAGLAVILDVVHNHLGPEGNYVSEFGPYFNNRYRTPWGEAINFDDRGCDEVRALVLWSVRQWVRDFHLDGLRLDAIHAIHDASPKHILGEVKEAVDDEAARLGRIVHVIAESDLNDVRLLNPPRAGGYGLDAQWSDDFHHCVHALLTGERNGYYADFSNPAQQLVKALNQTFVYDGCYSVFRGRRRGAPAGDHGGDRFVVSIQTHDQVGNRARGERLHQLVGPAQQRLAAGLLLLAPHIPLLFMGEEYGESRPFPYFCDFGDPALQEAVRSGRQEEFSAFHWRGEIPDPQAASTFKAARLSWAWPEGSLQAGLRRLYTDLLTARRTWPALRDFRHRHARLLAARDEGHVLCLQRGSPDRPQEQIEAYFNISRTVQPLPASAGQGRLLLSSEDSRYGGPAALDRTGQRLARWEFVVFGSQPGASS